MTKDKIVKIAATAMEDRNQLTKQAIMSYHGVDNPLVLWPENSVTYLSRNFLFVVAFRKYTFQILAGEFPLERLGNFFVYDLEVHDSTF